MGRSLADYLVYDFLPGWSGDERSQAEVEEFVMHVLKPRHLLTMRVSAEGERVERREE